MTGKFLLPVKSCNILELLKNKIYDYDKHIKGAMAIANDNFLERMFVYA